MAREARGGHQYNIPAQDIAGSTPARAFGPMCPVTLFYSLCSDRFGGREQTEREEAWKKHDLEREKL